MSKIDKAVVLDYVLGNDTNDINVAIALSIACNAKEYKERIVFRFLQSLRKTLHMELSKHKEGEWEVILDYSSPDGICDERYGGLKIRRADWAKYEDDEQHGYSIRIQWEYTSCNRIGIGVTKPIRQKPLAAGIIPKLLNEQFGKGNPYDTWEWWRFVDERWRDWSNEKALLGLWEIDEGVQYFTEEILKIKEIVGKHMADNLTRQG